MQTTRRFELRKRGKFRYRWVKYSELVFLYVVALGVCGTFGWMETLSINEKHIREWKMSFCTVWLMTLNVNKIKKCVCIQYIPFGCHFRQWKPKRPWWRSERTKKMKKNRMKLMKCWCMCYTHLPTNRWLNIFVRHSQSSFITNVILPIFQSWQVDFELHTYMKIFSGAFFLPLGILSKSLGFVQKKTRNRTNFYRHNNDNNKKCQQFHECKCWWNANKFHVKRSCTGLRHLF